MLDDPQDDQRHDDGDHREEIFAEAAGETHRTGQPERGTGGQPLHPAARLDDDAGRQEGDAAGHRLDDADRVGPGRVEECTELHQQVTGLPSPDTLSPEQRELYEGLVQKRVAILLEKAISALSHTADMARRLGLKSPWVPRIQEKLTSLRTQYQTTTI